MGPLASPISFSVKWPYVPRIVLLALVLEKDGNLLRLGPDFRRKFRDRLFDHGLGLRLEFIPAGRGHLASAAAVLPRLVWT